MLKKLTTLSLSLLLCASALPAQAGAMDAPEDVPPVQVEECENQVPSGEDPDAGIAPCYAVPQDPGPSYPGGLGPDTWGNGMPVGSGMGGPGT